MHLNLDVMGRAPPWVGHGVASMCRMRKVTSCKLVSRTECTYVSRTGFTFRLHNLFVYYSSGLSFAPNNVNAESLVITERLFRIRSPLSLADHI
jgi:hypothetical protein